jgi:phosphopantothenoylcysteine decarboxylase/phosphopantothenate--cysteine ligase
MDSTTYNDVMENTNLEPATQLQGKRILLGISGGIAAYKTVDLARKLTQAGAQVRCVLTEGATHFVSATALQAVTGVAVRHSLWDEAAEAAMSHIELARWADTLLIAPATADVMARLALGMANDLLTTLALATQAKLCLAPAMNGMMWRHPATQANLAVLQQRGANILMPESGSLACGEVDTGRMPESVSWTLRLYGKVKNCSLPLVRRLKILTPFVLLPIGRVVKWVMP